VTCPPPEFARLERDLDESKAKSNKQEATHESAFHRCSGAGRGATDHHGCSTGRGVSKHATYAWKVVEIKCPYNRLYYLLAVDADEFVSGGKSLSRTRN
jgi:hypothetical protein